jgi:hypothetical protein
LRFLAGAAISVAIVCLPFFIVAPKQFFHDVIAAQLTRDETGVAATTLAERARLLTGVSGWPGTNGSVVAWVLLGLLLVGIVARFVLGSRRPSRLEVFVLLGWVVIVGGMFESKTFYDHYAYLPAAWMMLLLGVLAASAAQALAGAGETARRGFVALGAVVAAAGLVFMGVQQVRFSHRYLTEAADPGALIAAIIPKGSCAFSDFPSDLIIANRYNAADRVCPQVTDPYGLYLADDDGRTPHLEPPSYRPEFAAQWRARLEQYDYVVLRIPFSSFVPFPPATQAWFAENYVLTAHLTQAYPDGFIDKQKDEYIYRRRTSG